MLNYAPDNAGKTIKLNTSRALNVQWLDWAAPDHQAGRSTPWLMYGNQANTSLAT